MCRIKYNITNMLQFIVDNIAKFDNKEEQNYYLNLYHLFKKNAEELISQKDSGSLKTVRKILSTLYQDYLIYSKSSDKKDTIYRKQMLRLCSLNSLSRKIIDNLAKTIWWGNISTYILKPTLDRELDLSLKRIIAHIIIYKFIRESKQEDIAEFIKGKNVNVQRAITFLGSLTLEDHITKCENNIKQLNILIRIFSNGLEVLENLYDRNNSVLLDKDDDNS